MATSTRGRYRGLGSWIPTLSPGGLWRQADFRRLWAAQSASLFGSEITTLALPLIAVLALDATPVQMGLLAAAGTAPFLLCSLPAGVWIDRRPRRPVLIAADVVRAGLLLSIPLTAWLDVLRIELLYAVTFLVGVLGVFFEVAHYAYVPSLVGRESVVEANSKLQISYSAAEAGGPGVAGLLVQFISAPGAIAIDAVSFLVSAILVLYATRELEISPVMLGIILAVGGIGAIPGALLSAPAARRFGVGPTIIGGWLIGAATWLLVPLATGPG